MAEASETPTGASIDRSERPGRVGLLLFLAALLVGAALSLSFVAPERAQPLILLLLALLGMAGVFFLFAMAIGAVQFSGQGARNDLTKAMADTAADGLVVVEDDGRILYANESYLVLAGGDSFADLKPVERLFVGAPEVSEAIYRLAQAARDGRAASEEVRVSPPPTGGRDFGWYRIRVRPLARPNGRTATLWTIADVTHERERQENVFQELQHAIDYLDHAPAGFLSIDPEGAVIYMNATLAAWLGHDLAQVGSGGLRLAEHRRHDDLRRGDLRRRAHGDLRRRSATPQRPAAAGAALSPRCLRPGRQARRFAHARPQSLPGRGCRRGAARRRGALRPLLQRDPDRHCDGEPRRSRRAVERLVRAAVRNAAAHRRERRGALDRRDRRGARPRTHRRRARLRRRGPGRAPADGSGACRRAEPLRPALAEPGERGRGRGRGRGGDPLRARHQRAAPARAAVRPGAEDAGGRAARRRGRARL